jgi:hypothetical protein
MIRPRAIGRWGRRIRAALILGWAAILLSLSNCGKKPSLVFDRPEAPRDRYYEIAWVDPRIVVSDSLYTLITSDRIDSFKVEGSSEALLTQDRSLIFEIDQPECFTFINLLDSKGQVIKPLLARNLPRGYYMFSLQMNVLPAWEPRSPQFFLKGEICDFEVIRRVP